ncbi:hypothetical protein ACGFYV_03765 [Streptomyces sp. NPDC048297]|uniref:Rv1733c family protein n=1 Tax=Streptomyces sp. NPDC048297 TaxID=3365531 RepID=UPI0037213088
MARTPPTTVSRRWLWRWRPNSLRRHSDVVEAWIVIATWLLVLAGGVVAGAVAAQATDSAFAARAARVHAVSARLTDAAPKNPAADGGYGNGRVWAAVRWSDADGSVHTDRAQVLAGAPAGSRVTVWTDRTDHVVPAPVTGTSATVQAVLTGALVAPLAGAAVWCVGWVVRFRLVRRRLAEWDEEWKQIGPRWGNLSGGGRG